MEIANKQQALQAQANSAMGLVKEEALNAVMSKITSLQKQQEITIPKNYSPQNAINSAWLLLQGVQDKNYKPALEVCSKNSIVQSLYDMVLQGLSPAKKQCYFIVRGTELCLDRSYFGSQVAVKRLKGVKDVNGNIVYEDDVFEYTIDPSSGSKKILKHEQKIGNINISKIKAAYVYIVLEDGNNHLEIMTIDQIKAAWNQGPMKGNSGAHKNFTDQMALKTVINRACKKYVNTSDDSDVFAEAFNRDYSGRYDSKDIIEDTDEVVKEEIKENANKKEIDIQEEANVIDVDPTPADKEKEQPQQTKLQGPGF